MNNAYAAYANTKINTASAADLTLMLYEGAIKFCNIAILGIEQKDIEKAHNNIVKADRIVAEFQTTLNRDYKVAEDFDAVYGYIRQCLLEANIAKDKEIIEDALFHLRFMRDTWREVMQMNK